MFVKRVLATEGRGLGTTGAKSITPKSKFWRHETELQSYSKSEPPASPLFAKGLAKGSAASQT